MDTYLSSLGQAVTIYSVHISNPTKRLSVTPITAYSTWILTQLDLRPLSILYLKLQARL
jgi:hypothetical protein